MMNGLFVGKRMFGRGIGCMERGFPPWGTAVHISLDFGSINWRVIIKSNL